MNRRVLAVTLIRRGCLLAKKETDGRDFDDVEHKYGMGMVGNADMVENEEMANGWQRDGR